MLRFTLTLCGNDSLLLERQRVCGQVSKQATSSEAHGPDSSGTTSELPLLAQDKLEASPCQAPRLNRRHTNIDIETRTGRELGHLLGVGDFSYHSTPHWTPLQVRNAIADAIFQSPKNIAISHSRVQGQASSRAEIAKVVTAGGLNGPRPPRDGCIATQGYYSVPRRVLCHCIK